jgi:hypothetical protein
MVDALRGDARPKLMMWAVSDPVLPLETARRLRRRSAASLIT